MTTSLSKLSKDTWKITTTQNKTDFIESLEHYSDEYTDLELSEEEALKVQKYLKKISTGASPFALLRCAGNDCPFKLNCPLYNMKDSDSDIHGKAPVGKTCPLESSLLTDATTKMVSEYEVEPTNYTELNIIVELAEIEVLLWRLNQSLARPQNAELVMEQPVGVDRDGNAVLQQQVSPIFEQKQKLSKRKSQLIKVMVGDRQEKYKKEAALKQKTEEDGSSRMADIRQQLGALQRQVTDKVNQTIDAQIVTPEDLIANSNSVQGDEPSSE